MYVIDKSLDLLLKLCGCDSWRFHFRVTTLVKLFTHMYLVTKQCSLVVAKQQPGSAAAGKVYRLQESNGSLYIVVCMTKVLVTF